MKNYGLKLKYGDPTLNDIKINYEQGLFTFVVISPNLIEDITNELFLQAIGVKAENYNHADKMRMDYNK